MSELMVGAASSDTHQKTLRINLDPRWYGTIAEIGAGQEVVRWFFRVGGAAGTVAKSISAYDMAVSDAVYGKADRYVSASACRACSTRNSSSTSTGWATSGGLDHILRVRRHGGGPGYRGSNEVPRLDGREVQAQPHDRPSQIVMHVRMLDLEAALQQEALGIVGVNLLHGAFFEHHEPDRLIEAWTGSPPAASRSTRSSSAGSSSAAWTTG
jgi:hypothetical protein